MAPADRPRRSRRPLVLAIGVLVVIGALVAVAAIAKLGPFKESGQTESAFLAQGDRVCKQAHEQFAALQGHPPTDAAGAADLTRKLIAISQAEIAKIRALDAPSRLQPALDRYLRSRGGAVAILRRGLAAAEQEDFQAYARAQAEIAAGQVRRLQLARAVGFTECSRPLLAGAPPGQ